MNAEYFRDLLMALEGYGTDLSKVKVRCEAHGPDSNLNLEATGTTVIAIDKNSEGSITLEFK